MESNINRNVNRLAFKYGSRVTKGNNPSNRATKIATRTRRSFDSSTYLMMRKMNTINKVLKGL